MSSTIKLAVTTAVLLSTLSFTATAGSTRYFADVTPKSYADEQNWDFEALIRHEDDGERRLILEIGGLAESNTYVPKGQTTEVPLITDCAPDEEEPTLTVCETATPIQIIVTLDPKGAKLKRKFTTSEVVFEDDPNNLCGGSGVVLRTDKGDSVPNVQPGDKVVFKLKKAVSGTIGNGKFSEDEPAPADPANLDCPIEVEPEEG